jgi:hypothetical protein
VRDLLAYYWAVFRDCLNPERVPLEDLKREDEDR